MSNAPNTEIVEINRPKCPTCKNTEHVEKKEYSYVCAECDKWFSA